MNFNDISSFKKLGILCLLIVVAGCASFPLHQAIQGGETGKVSKLVAKRKYIDSYDRGGNTPLAWAANRGNIEVIKQLIEAGADVNQKNKGTFDTTPLYVAASENKIDAVKFFIEHGADVNSSPSDGTTPLLIAAEKGYDKIVELLVENGADIEAQNINGVRALSFAARYGHLKIVETLLGKGADINFFTNNELAPLHEAATAGHLDVVKLLLAKGADINMLTQLGDQTALTQATWKGHEHIVEYLVDQGADVNAGKPRTALLLAMQNNDLPMVDFLINHGALPQVATDTKDEVYATARIHAWFGDEAVRGRNRERAVDFYNIAAGYFEQATTLFSDAVNQLNQEIKTAQAVDFWGDVFLSALEGVAGAAANAQAHSNYRQWSQIGALRDASSSGTGMSGYYTALSSHQKAYHYNHKAFYGSPGDDLFYPGRYDSGYTGNPLEIQKLENVYLRDASQQASLDTNQVLDCLKDANRSITKCTTKESENKKLMRFLINSQKIWATGIFDDLGKALKQGAQANNSRQFWAAYAPEIKKGFATANQEGDLRENEYLVTYSDDFFLTNETFYLLSNEINVAKKTINLMEIEDYILKADSNQWNVTFKLNSGEMVEMKGLKLVPKVEYVDFLRKQILGAQWQPIPIKDKQTLIATATNKELVEFLVNTHMIWKKGDLHGLDEAYKKEADSLTPEQFVDRYANQIEKIFNVANQKRKLQGDECLVSVSHHNGFLLTNKTLYLFTKGFEKEEEIKIVNLSEIESYSFKLGIVRDGGIAVKLKTGETIKVRFLKGYPSVASIDFLRKQKF